MMPAALAAFGGISLVGWILSTAGAILLAKVFSNLSKLMPLADGGPYAYSRKGLGDFAGTGGPRAPARCGLTHCAIAALVLGLVELGVGLGN